VLSGCYVVSGLVGPLGRTVRSTGRFRHPACVHACYGPAVDRVGIRELRNNVAAVVRRAAAGERIAVTVDGVPAAQLGPLEPGGGALTLDDLIAAGLARPPGRADHPGEPGAEDVPVDARPDAVLDALRGG
jgi:prevent-host-death family protein